jgi:hypothetical protein
MAAACGDIYSVELLLNQNASIGMHDPVRSKKESFQKFCCYQRKRVNSNMGTRPCIGPLPTVTWIL